MATIEINDEYRIASDEHQWIVQRKSVNGKTGEVSWMNKTFHAEIDQATKSLSGLLLRLSDANGLGEILDEIRRIDAMIAQAMSVRMAA